MNNPERNSMSNTLKSMIAVVSLLGLIFAGLVVALVIDRTGDDTDRADNGSSEAPSPEPSPDDTDSDPAPAEPQTLEEYEAQEIAWSDCGDGLECGTLLVPIDYADPAGERFELNLKRVPAGDQSSRVGSLVVNPGGPGAPGSEMADNADFYFSDALRDRVDIVAFDPRGTGDSNPIDCLTDEGLDEYFAADPSPDTPAEEREVMDGLGDLFEGCVERSDSLIGHVTTVEAARDMDVLRAALDEEQLSYLGFSYGTRLGATYAELFPDNVGRFVLDGAIDPSLGFVENSLSQARGFERALRSYVQNCVDGGGCFLGDTVDAGIETIQELLADIDAQPLPTSIGRELTVGNAFYGVVTPLYSESNWPALDQGLREALDGRGDTLLLLSDSYGSREADGSYSDNSVEAFVSISCLDDPTSIPPGNVDGRLADFREASPTFGDVFAWGLVGCRGIQVERSEPQPELVAEGAPPIVVLGTTRDPATPYEEAVAMAEQLDSGLLVSRDGDGHTAYNKGNACIDDAVEGYLLEGEVPEDGLEC